MLDHIPDPTDPGPDPEPLGARIDYLLERAVASSHGPTPRRPRRNGPLDVIVAGGGPAAIEAALALRALAPKATHVRLLAPEPSYVYRPLSVVEPFAAGHAREYSLELLAAKGTEVIRDSLAEVDAATRTVKTGDGELLRYDALIVAAGARVQRALPHCVNFTGPADTGAMHGLIQDIEGGWCKHVAFVAPVGASWTLPLYELALQTAERANDLCLDDVRVTVVTHEKMPLDVFGTGASASVNALLGDAGVEVVTSARPSVPRAGRVETGLGRPVIEANRVVALGVPVGREIAGLPADEDHFLPVDGFGRIEGVDNVYAAGDGASYPIKQGGLAAQEADLAVATLLADAGLRSAPDPYEPVLRGMLIAGTRTLYLRRDGYGHRAGEASPRPLWWPPTKIAGHFLAPFLDGIDAERPTSQFERRRATRDGAVRRRAIVGRLKEDADDALIAMLRGDR